MSVFSRVALAACVLAVQAAALPAQHCLGTGSAPVAAGFVRASVWTGEHRYARRTGAALAAPYRRLVGAVRFERNYDREFAASINSIGASIVADLPLGRSEILWLCPVLGVDRVLGPTDFTGTDESRFATDLSVGLGVALAIDQSDYLRVVPSLSARYVATSERWTHDFEPDRRRRGSFTEAAAGLQFIANGDAALAVLAQIPFAASDDPTFPFWRRRGEVAWQLVFSFQLPLRGER